MKPTLSSGENKSSMMAELTTQMGCWRLSSLSQSSSCVIPSFIIILKSEMKLELELIFSAQHNKIGPFVDICYGSQKASYLTWRGGGEEQGHCPLVVNGLKLDSVNACQLLAVFDDSH